MIDACEASLIGKIKKLSFFSSIFVIALMSNNLDYSNTKCFVLVRKGLLTRIQN